jgi:glycosyltransferase involved in cell wall biosynthesis
MNLGSDNTHNKYVPPQLAVLIPCYNEEETISKVVSDFKTTLPDATIYVYDNNSTDRSAELARQAGAVVREERLQGKGNVVRRMFADVEADIYVLVDGDDTYDAAIAPEMIDCLRGEYLDMVNAARQAEMREAYRSGHRLGNAMFTHIVAMIFGRQFSDLLSGYRVLSRRFVKSFPALSSGFEIETELTIHALELRMPVREIVSSYKERPTGSESKLHTVRDGVRILSTILVLVKVERPLLFFSVIGAVLGTAAVILGIPIIITFMGTGLVPRFPTAILATGIMILAFLSLACGLVLDTVTRGRVEMKRMQYLGIPIGRTGPAPHEAEQSANR